MNSIVGFLSTKYLAACSTTFLQKYPGRENMSTEPGCAMCSSFCFPTKAAAVPPDCSAASNTVGTWIQPRSGCHEFQNRPCSLTSKPDNIAACEGSVDARRIVRAFI